MKQKIARDVRRDKSKKKKKAEGKTEFLCKGQNEKYQEGNKEIKLKKIKNKKGKKTKKK